MIIHELTAAQCADLLERTTIGRLGCARDNQPSIVPISFYFDRQEHCLYSFATVGQKIEWMRENPKVCVEVDDITDKDHWTTVLVFGRYEELTESSEDKAARRRAQQLFESRPEWWFPAAGKTSSREPHAFVIYRIRIERISGRRASRSRT